MVAQPRNTICLTEADLRMVTITESKQIPEEVILACNLKITKCIQKT